MSEQTTMMNQVSQSVDELQVKMGAHVRRLRLERNLGVEAVAERTGLAEKSVRNLEGGRGSTTETLLKVLVAVDAQRVLRALTPPDVNLVTEDAPKIRQRARRATLKSAK
jgi:transcriptional regulator with XRE-family HTH domain